MAKTRIKILTVCGAGVGSSLMVKMNVEEVAAKNGIKCKVENSDAASAKSVRTDIIITSMAFYKLIKDSAAKHIIILDNMVNAKELEEKLLPVCKKIMEEA